MGLWLLQILYLICLLLKELFLFTSSTLPLALPAPHFYISLADEFYLMGGVNSYCIGRCTKTEECPENHSRIPKRIRGHKRNLSSTFSQLTAWDAQQNKSQVGIKTWNLKTSSVIATYFFQSAVRNWRIILSLNLTDCNISPPKRRIASLGLNVREFLLMGWLKRSDGLMPLDYSWGYIKDFFKEWLTNSKKYARKHNESNWQKIDIQQNIRKLLKACRPLHRNEWIISAFKIS